MEELSSSFRNTTNTSFIPVEVSQQRINQVVSGALTTEVLQVALLPWAGIGHFAGGHLTL